MTEQELILQNIGLAYVNNKITLDQAAEAHEALMAHWAELESE